MSCNSTYNPFIELLKLIAQLFYLIPAILLHYLILIALLRKYKKVYSQSPFFNLFAAESVVSLTQLLLTTIFYRPACYLTFLCPILYPSFPGAPIVLKLIYTIACYTRPAKCALQIAICLNRMTCVAFPMRHRKFWSSHTRHVIVAAGLIPFAVIWNVIISEEKLVTFFGGVMIDYDRYVEWASLSLFNLITFTTTILLTLLFTIITMREMMRMKTRQLASERILTIVTILSTIGYFFSAIMQICFAYMPTGLLDLNVIFVLNQMLSSEFLCIWPPLVMVLFNRKLRFHVVGRLVVSPVISVSSPSFGNV